MNKPSSIKLIDCIKYENSLMSLLNSKLLVLKKNHNIIPSLATILVGNNKASEIYVNKKTHKAKTLGIAVNNFILSDKTSEADLIALIKKLNNDPNINAILVQLPLTDAINSNIIIDSILPLKDVDGLTSYNLGLLAGNQKTGIFPCTPLGILYTLKQQTILQGKKVVMIGRSRLVGLPTSLLLLNENATVTIANYHTQNLKDICKQADILIVAIGNPYFITSEYIKEGAIVIDVGINSVNLNNRSVIVGDVNTQEVLERVAKITPVPKGIGRLTTTFLMYNTYKATLLQNNIFDDSYSIFN